MLIHLSLRNFMLTPSLDLDFESGFIAISGESGAGKSLILESLDLLAGARARPDVVQVSFSKASLSAAFNISQLKAARDWLAAADLLDGDECIIRRDIAREGRSRCYINGFPVNLSQLRALASYLIVLHGQNAHHELLDRSSHLSLLDRSAGLEAKAAQVGQAWRSWQRHEKLLAQARNAMDISREKHQLLQYQAEELGHFNLREGEFSQLENEQLRLNNIEEFQARSRLALEMLEHDDQGCLSLMNALVDYAEAFPEDSEDQGLRQMLEEARINLQESARLIQDRMDRIEVDEGRLQAVNERIAAALELSRKYRVPAAQLHQLQAEVEQELAELDEPEQALEDLESQNQRSREIFEERATALGEARLAAAQRFESAVSKNLSALGVQGEFRVVLSIGSGSSNGFEHVEFMLSTIAGQPPGPISRVASGGELSRLNLAMQLVLAEKQRAPSLVFDEVDVGIGGSTAQVVGQFLRELGSKSQVFCVTHLAQVASQAHRHYQVSRIEKSGKRQSEVQRLDQPGRITELARMLGSHQNSQKGQELASELLAISGC